MLKISQAERALGQWKTGHYVVNNDRALNNFSSDNWTSRTDILIQVAQKLTNTAWAVIYAEVDKILNKSEVIDSASEEEEPLAALCSDLTDMFGHPFEYDPFSGLLACSCLLIDILAGSLATGSKFEEAKRGWNAGLQNTLRVVVGGSRVVCLLENKLILFATNPCAISGYT